MTSKIKVDNISDQNDNNIINESGDVITVGASGDTVAVAGNIVKSNALQASDGGNIVNQSGTTITIGASGDTVSLASGASQSGFGRTGTVNWQTSIKTSDFTAANGEGYFVDTSSGGVTVTLPSSPSAGNIIAVKDYANTADTNRITFNRNGSNVDGTASNPVIANEGGAVTLVFADSTKGWLVTDAAQKSDMGYPSFIAATGGTVTTVCTNFKVHTFTGPGTFTVSSVGNSLGSNTIDYLVVAGGGGGGHGQACYQAGGAGGGGGYRESSGTASGAYTVSPLGACVSALPVTATGYPVTVGGGGAGAPNSQAPNPGGSSGSNSVFTGSTTITSAGGGGGSGYCGSTPNTAGAPGGSGGGNGTVNNPSPGFTPLAAATGNQPPVTPPQGNPGGKGTQAPFGRNHSARGGGGAPSAGGDGNVRGAGGNGGTGGTSSINGTPTQRAGGGSGASDTNAAGSVSGGGGVGGGNPLGPSKRVNGTAGTTNTGGGGGGGAAADSGTPAASGGSGGSGIVIIRYKFQ